MAGLGGVPAHALSFKGRVWCRCGPHEHAHKTCWDDDRAHTWKPSSPRQGTSAIRSCTASKKIDTNLVRTPELHVHARPAQSPSWLQGWLRGAVGHRSPAKIPAQQGSNI
eukprot:1158534-Pelagomonas_calceolata.AAC.7